MPLGVFGWEIVVREGLDEEEQEEEEQEEDLIRRMCRYHSLETEELKQEQ